VETAYISEVNTGKKVKSDAQVAKNKNSDFVHKPDTLQTAANHGMCYAYKPASVYSHLRK